MNKIIEDSHISSISGEKIVLVGGCFDILHKAHLDFLSKSKQLGDFLVVLLESDENIRNMKGKDRPINNQQSRAEQLSQIDDVDYVILLKKPDSSKYYYNLVNLLRPAIIAVTSDDPLITLKKEQAEQVGGRVVAVMDRNKAFSSTQIIDSI